jgi:Tfp pilus assembly protein PilF
MIYTAPTTTTAATLRNALLAALLAAALGACAIEPVRQASPPPPASTEAIDTLNAGLRLYEDGQYDLSADRLRAAIQLGLRTTPDLIRAHKHLAFILCATGKTDDCADSFRAVLKLDPGFELTKAEAGHPMWGPVFVAVKKETGR